MTNTTDRGPGMVKDFPAFAKAIAASRPKKPAPYTGLVLSFDPGETTGFCAMFDLEVLLLKQIPTPKDDVYGSWKNLNDIISSYYTQYAGKRPQIPFEATCEDYRVYSWKADDHKWSQVHTIKVVGFIQAICGHLSIPLSMNMASAGKHFFTDERLKQQGLYDVTVGQKHGRDALRHACNYVCRLTSTP